MTDTALSYRATPSPGWMGAQRLRDALPRGCTPFPVQLAALEHLEARGHQLCAMHPGAGKTPVGLMAARMYPGPAFVSAPPSLVDQWHDRALEWGYTEDDVQTVQTRKEAAQWTPRRKLSIVADSLLERIHPTRTSLLVVDECHRFKEWNAERTNILLGRDSIGAQAGAILGLSGTPSPNGPHELFPFLYRTAREIAPSWEAYTSRYCPTYQKNVGARVVDCNDVATNIEELNRKLRETVLFRPRREDVQGQLPAVRREVHRVTLPEESGLSVQQAFEVLADAGEGSAPFATQRREMGIGKARASLNYLRTLVDGGARPLIWCYHQEAANYLADKLNVPVIHGGVSITDRRAGIALFAAGNAPALVATIHTAGTGLDGLQRICSLSVMVERDYVPSNNEQTEARIWRVGQTFPVQFVTVLCSDALEVAMTAALTRKSTTIERIQA